MMRKETGRRTVMTLALCFGLGAYARAQNPGPGEDGPAADPTVRAIVPKALPTVALSANKTWIVQVETVDFTADASGGTPPYTFEWDLDDDSAYEQNTGATPSASYLYDAPGTFTATVRVTDDGAQTATDSVEIFVMADTDRDGLPDWWEEKYLGSLASWGGSDDPDEDNWTNFKEYEEGTDPTNPDTDGDGIIDSEDPDPLTPAGGGGGGGGGGGCGSAVVSVFVMVLAAIIARTRSSQPA